MYLDHHALKRISRILNMIDSVALLLNDKGEVLFPEGDSRKLTLPEAVRGKAAGPFVYGGVTLAGVPVLSGTDSSPELYICLTGDSRDVQNCASLCAELIALTLESYSDSSDKNHIFRKMLRGECSKAEVDAVCAEYSLQEMQTRCVICVQISGTATDKISEVLSGFTSAEGEFWTDVSAKMFAAVKLLPEENTCIEMYKAALGLYEELTDYGIDASIGVSDPRENVHELAEALNEASNSINIGSVYCPTEHVFVFRRLLLERFVHSLNGSAAQNYSAKVFNQSTTRLFTDEMINTIDVFFKSNLNLSEAARTLGIHRNTLVYRLEKVQAVTGFDLREFDDAITFKMMMLLSRNSIAGKPRI